VREMQTRYGVLNTFDPAEDLISKFLLKYGEWAQLELRFVSSCLSDGARICDIGAFLGTFSLGISQSISLSTVLYVDANPAVIPLLRKNAQRNPQMHSTVIEAVVGGEEALSAFVVPENRGSFSMAPGDASGRDAVAPALISISLDELLERHGPFDLIKIDAEGMEYKILSADNDLLGKIESHLWLECNAIRSSLQLVELLLSAGFKVHYFAFPAINADNFCGEKSIEFPFAYEAGLWASKSVTPCLSSDLAGAGCYLIEISSVEMLRGALWRTPRWAPESWSGVTSVPEVIALASHALLGEDFSQFLISGDADTTARPWVAPLQIASQKEISKTKSENEMLITEVTNARSTVRAHEVMLAKERERSRDAVRSLEAELARLNAVIVASANETNERAAVIEQLEIRNRLTSSQTNELANRVHDLSERLHAQDALLRTQEAQIRGALEQVSAIHRSKSWRVMMPARMLGRLARGEWREVGRLMRTRK
jgi:FkbM family methyltransferase